MKRWPHLAVFVLIVLAGVQGKAKLDEYGTDRFLAGYAQGKEAVSPQAPQEVREFAQAFCNNDAEAAARFIPPQYLGSIQQAFAEAVSRGATCVSLEYVGSFKRDTEILYSFAIDDGSGKLWWYFTFEDGLVTNIE